MKIKSQLQADVVDDRQADVSIVANGIGVSVRRGAA
jgi:hypothetical protein